MLVAMRIFVAMLVLLSCKKPERAAPDPTGTVPDTTTTAPPCVPMAEVVINELSAANQSVILDEDDDSPDWLELLNTGSSPGELGGWTLSDDKDEPGMWTLPVSTLDPGEFLVIFASGKDRTDTLHTNFSLRADGEKVRLFDGAGCEVDEIDPGQMWADQSFGRTSDGAFGYFMEPTPGAPNDTESRPGFAEKPTFAPNPGFYPEGTEVSLSGGAESAIYVAFEGHEPVDAGAIYESPTVLDGAAEASVMRARAYEVDLWPSPVATATYFGRDSGFLPVISLVTDPANFFDSDTGIYVMGDGAEPDYPYFGANFWQDWERPIHISLWEPDGRLGLAMDAGVNIHGGWSRGLDQRSLRITARGGYGHSSIPYEVFPGYGIAEFSSIILRNSGNDWYGCLTACAPGSHLRDGLMHRIAEGADLDTVAYRPVEAYLNGEYWGIYNIRERPGAGYIAEHYGIEDIDLLEAEALVINGDNEHYLDLVAYLRNSDLSDPVAYSDVEAMVDIASLSNYFIFQIWFDNTDWPGHNIKFWRPRTADGRWRWLLYDTDFGLGLFGASVANDTLAYAVDANGSWPNPPWSTELLRRMLDIPEFRAQFINRYADFLNTQLRPTETQAALDEVVAGIAPVMPRHADRWGESLPGGWESETAGIRQWLGERPAYATTHIVDHFGLAGTWTLDLAADPPGSGTFALTALEVDGPYSGSYFLDVPVTITAVPAPGYSFAGWSDPLLPATATVTLDPGGSVQLIASFQ